MKKLFLLFFICLYPSIGFSAINEYKTDVYFANGIFTKKRQKKGQATLIYLPLYYILFNSTFRRRQCHAYPEERL